MFDIYESYVNIKGITPIEYSLTDKKIKEYVKNPQENYSFISFCMENSVIPFKDELIEEKRSCENCAFLRNEINGDRYFCGDMEVGSENVCDSHMFSPAVSESLLHDVYNR